MTIKSKITLYLLLLVSLSLQRCIETTAQVNPPLNASDAQDDRHFKKSTPYTKDGTDNTEDRMPSAASTEYASRGITGIVKPDGLVLNKLEKQVGKAASGVNSEHAITPKFGTPVTKRYINYLRQTPSPDKQEHSDRSTANIMMLLRNRLNDEELAELILGETVYIDKRLHSAQSSLMHFWLKDEKTAGEVFKLAYIKKDNANPLDSANFDFWTSYVAMGSMTRDDYYRSVLKVLVSEYGEQGVQTLLRDMLTRTLVSEACWQEAMALMFAYFKLYFSHEEGVKHTRNFKTMLQLKDGTFLWNQKWTAFKTAIDKLGRYRLPATRVNLTLIAHVNEFLY